MSEIIVSKEDVMAILANSLKDSLGQTGYSNPTRKFTEEIINEHADEIRGVLKDVLGNVLADDEFKEIVREEFKRKVAKMLVGDLSGSVEKAVNAFRQDPTLKADMIKAIEKLISDDKA